MSQQELEQLDELKADGEDSAVADPVTPEGGAEKKRKADKKQGDMSADKIEDTVKTPQGTADKKSPARAADKGMKESVEEMFAGEDLTEEFKEKAVVVFEAAVNFKLQEEAQRLEEEFNQKLDEQVETAVADLVEKTDSYLDYVVEQWMQQNEIAIEKGIRAEIAESFLTGLRDLFVEHNVDLPEESVDVIVDMTEQLETTETKLNDALNENIELRKAVEEAKRVDVFESVSSDLAETQVEKLKALTEGLEFVDLDDYKRKVEIVKENYFSEAKALTESVDDEPLEEPEVINSNNEVAKYADAISRTIRK